MRAATFESVETFSPEEFTRWVEERSRIDPLNHYELLNGRVVMTPPAGYPHGAIGGAIAAALFHFARASRLGQVFDSSQGFALPSGDTLEPDISFISTERWEAGPAPGEGEFIRIVPDLVVEILSPSTSSRDRGEKKAIYERNGVREYWIVDPRGRRVWQFVRHGDRFDKGTILIVGERLVSHVLTGLEVDPAEFFPV